MIDKKGERVGSVDLVKIALSWEDDKNQGQKRQKKKKERSNDVHATVTTLRE